MNSKRRITIISCSLFIMLGFLVNGISLLFEERRMKSQAKTSETTVASSEFSNSHGLTEDDESKKNYLLKITDGIVVVYEYDNENKPIFVTDIYAGTLRNYDRELLSEGIRVTGERELQSILEDFSS